MKDFKLPDVPQAWLIEWEDHCSVHRWHDINAYDNTPVTCRTIGFIVKENKKYLTIVSTQTREGQGGGDFTIIKSCIIKRKKIKL